MKGDKGKSSGDLRNRSSGVLTYLVNPDFGTNDPDLVHRANVISIALLMAMLNIVFGAIFSHSEEQRYLIWASPLMVAAAVLGRTRFYRVGCGIAIGNTFALVACILAFLGTDDPTVIIPLTYFTGTILMMSFLLKLRWLVFLLVIQVVMVLAFILFSERPHEIILTGWLPLNLFVAILILLSRILQDRNAARIKNYQEHLEDLVAERSRDLEEANELLREKYEHEQEISRQLEHALSQAEVLLKELYHRTKNNMQVISSILHIQSASAANPEAKKLFDVARDRIQSMALVHQMLLKSNDLTFIDVTGYLETLSAELLRTYRTGEDSVVCEITGEPISISIEQAVPLGLVINELLSNALKYAFPENRKGTISIRTKKKEDDMVEIEIRDDGIGLSGQTELEKGEGLGYRLINEIVTGQLKGSLSVTSDDGKGVKGLLLFKARPFARKEDGDASHSLSDR